MTKTLLPINHDYSVHSGVFAGIDNNIYMKLSDKGEYLYGSKTSLNNKQLLHFNKVDIMSDYSDNEDIIANSLFSNIKNIKHNKIIGYHQELYAGYVKESNFRERASSGGFGAWLLCELLRLKEIDGVIHPHAVDPSKNDGILFKYHISRTQKEVLQGAKTIYYPLELSEVLKEVKKKPGKYAVVAISDFITELRLLCEQDKIFKKRLVYMIGLFNAHQKTTQYTEALAWQQGIRPGNLKSIDFRVKTERSAGDYDYEVRGKKDGKDKTIISRMTSTALGQWHLGFFKSKFSDFTDNAFNELADITLGDAWLPEYSKDPKGNNILVIRNPKLSEIIKKASKEDRIKLDELSEEQIIASQGMVQHIITELPYRLYKNRRFNKFTPSKRVQPSKHIPAKRREIQDLRHKVVRKNDYIYSRAKQRNDFTIYNNFLTKMSNLNDKIYESRNPNSLIMETKKQLIRIKHKTRIRTRSRLLKYQITTKARASKLLKLKIMRSKRNGGVIITLTSLFNYGNIIQRYALRKALYKKGYNFDSIIMPHYMDTSNRDIFGNMEDFVTQYIGTKSYKIVKSYDYCTYVVGSDQVWRNWYGNDWQTFAPYFLEFVDNNSANRIAYGASFGVDNLEQAGINGSNMTKITNLLQKFSHISVREKSGVSMAEQITNNKCTADVVLDPTLLLKASDYSKLINRSSEKNSKTARVFCYILDESADKTRFIKNIARVFGNDFYILSPDTNKRYESVEFWLKGFRDADFIITDSFHGTVFAIINNKDFIAISNQRRGNDRFISLFNSLDINTERLIDEMNISDNIDVKTLSSIDWNRVNAKRKQLRENSIKWLLSAIRNKQ